MFTTFIGLLLPLLNKTAGARIVTVASAMHYNAAVYPKDQLNDPKLNSSGWQVSLVILNRFASLVDLLFLSQWTRYSLSKAMNILFARKLAGELKDHGSSIISVGAHPGTPPSFPSSSSFLFHDLNFFLLHLFLDL